MDMIASIDDQIERLKEMRAHLVAEQQATFDAAQNPLPIAEDDWIEWSGGECPVELMTRVCVKDRGGAISFGPAFEEYWRHDGISLDIIAYRIAGERT